MSLPYFENLASVTSKRVFTPSSSSSAVTSSSFSAMSSSNSRSESHSSSADVLSAADFSKSAAASPSPEHAPTANDLLMAAYDPVKLHPLAGLGDKLDYLLLEDDKTNDLPGAGTAIPSRGWSDDLCYGTGTMYLSGRCRSLSNYSIRNRSSRFGLRLFPAPLPPYLAISDVPFLGLLLFWIRHMLNPFFQV